MVLAGCSSTRNTAVTDNGVKTAGPSYSLIDGNDQTASTSYARLSESDATGFNDIHAFIAAKTHGLDHGPGSVNFAAQPLFIIDGVRASSVDDLRPADVYSVRVVNDGSQAIYGFAGVAGVVEIVTKAAHDQKEAELAARKAEIAARKAAKAEAREAKKKK